MKITRAYIEGFVGGFVHTNADHFANPYQRPQSRSEWEEGRARGVLLRHFHCQTEPAGEIQKAQLKELNRLVRGK